MSSFRMSKEAREALEAIPDKEYAEQQIAWHKEQMKYWQKELKEIKDQEDSEED